MTKFVIRCSGGPLAGDRIYEDDSPQWPYGWPPPEELPDGEGGYYELDSYSDWPPTDPERQGAIRGAAYLWRKIGTGGTP